MYVLFQGKILQIVVGNKIGKSGRMGENFDMPVHRLRCARNRAFTIFLCISLNLVLNAHSTKPPAPHTHLGYELMPCSFLQSQT